VAFLLAVLTGCEAPKAAEPASHGGESWSLTAWGERYEVFPEVDPLVAGEVAVAHTHVTRLEDFAALAEGRVEIVLSDARGEAVFAAEAARPGVFSVELRPERTGLYDLTFRIRDAGAPGGGETIRGGQVEVGTTDAPGGLRVAPAPRGGRDGGEPQAFLKEQQWNGTFATAWVRRGTLPASVSGLARLRPPAGGERTVAAPMAGVVLPPGPSGAWPFEGLAVRRGAPLFRIVPLVAPDQSLPALEAAEATLAAELELAQTRRERLEALLAVEAVSPREVEEARVQVTTLAARHGAARRDLETARAARAGHDSTSGVALPSPLTGTLAEVYATAGATVDAGAPLARVVRTDAVWIEVELAPADARKIVAEGIRGVLLEDPEQRLHLADGLRLVAASPEVSPQTGTVAVLLEAPTPPGLSLGTTVQAHVFSALEREGIIVPASAVVDDGGVTVAYLQLTGESFVRQQVQVVERQGERLRVEGLLPGQRLVVQGGDTLRRASLMSTGEAHGHVH
jgi:RND family efflux transporter MFP subunit